MGSNNGVGNEGRGGAIKIRGKEKAVVREAIEHSAMGQ